MKKTLLLKFLLISLYFTQAWAIDLSWPISCQLGVDCIAFESNKNVDISLMNQTTTPPHFDVKAAAAGKVKRIREGESDQSDLNLSAEKACGNGIVIEHEDGWESQYCHLKKDSIVVHVGEQVAAEKVLGKMGSSGKTTQPRLLFSLRQKGQSVDPYEAKLWRDKTLAAQELGLLDIGMSNKQIDVNVITNNPVRETHFTRQDPVMLAWARVFNVKQGDQQKFIFYSPDGNVYRRPIEEKIQTNHSEWITVAGYPLQNNQMPIAYNGEWRMVYLMKRGDKPWQELAELRFKLED